MLKIHTINPLVCTMIEDEKILQMKFFFPKQFSINVDYEFLKIQYCKQNYVIKKKSLNC